MHCEEFLQVACCPLLDWPQRRRCWKKFSMCLLILLPWFLYTHSVGTDASATWTRIIQFSLLSLQNSQDQRPVEFFYSFSIKESRWPEQCIFGFSIDLHNDFTQCSDILSLVSTSIKHNIMASLIWFLVITLSLSLGSLLQSSNTACWRCDCEINQVIKRTT